MLNEWESKIESKFRKEVKRIGGAALKFVSPGLNGVPDRIVLMPNGKLYFAELKRPGEKLRPLQEKRKKQLESLGFQVCVISSYEEIEVFIDAIQTLGISTVCN